MELASFGLHYMRTGESFSFTRVHEQERRTERDIAQRTKSGTSLPQQKAIIHPYIGNIRNPDHPGIEINVYPEGYIAEEDAIAASQDPGVVIVGLSGASVMFQLYRYKPARDILSQQVAELPKFKGKRVLLVMLTNPGYKQPQQLFSVANYLMQGGRLDLLVNLDGKNEVTLPSLNARMGKSPYYPYVWSAFFKAGYTLDDMEMLESAAKWKRIRGTGLSMIKTLDFSVTASTLWLAADEYFQYRVQQALQASQSDARDLPLYIGGPAMDRAQRDAMPTRIWTQGSLGLQGLAVANGFEYVHFLQPNQYVPDSKPLSANESHKAFRIGIDEQTVRQYYPLLIEEIPRLREKGVKVSSLTQVFAGRKETLYIDTCCHLNDQGHRLLALAMASGIAAELAPPAPKTENKRPQADAPKASSAH
ncbi:MAG: hypothetical protein EBV03_10305 [Proteobacteria bacterium]|nr:hypothetical protein [Pseudomonadota bacterium]